MTTQTPAQADDANLGPFIKLAGSIGAAEVLQHVYLRCPTGVYKPQTPKALQHLIKLGYLRLDYGKGSISVCHEKIQTDLMAISDESLPEAA